MEIWVLEWSYPSDGETNITLWANKEDAQRQALDEIQDVITNDWDMDDEDASLCADQIEMLTQDKRYGEAIERFNGYQDDNNSDYGQYWRVYSRELLTGDSGEAPTIPAPANYRASSPGATCRGPCGQANSYAYADRSDGTYVCRQCSTFQHIFGVSKS